MVVWGRDRAFVDDIKFTTELPVGAIQGTIDLQDFVPGGAPVLVDITVMQGSTLVKTGSAVISETSNSYRIDNIPSGTYSVIFKAASWLKQTINNVVVPSPANRTSADRQLLAQAQALTIVPDDIVTSQFVMTSDPAKVTSRRAQVADVIERLQ